MSKYLPTIGLEVHAELCTKTKMFCDCPNNPNEKRANINVCPICLGHPGALPVINRKAIEMVIKIGFAVKGEINDNFKFDRKNYFYPDLPKGYQISQSDLPIVKGGIVDISSYLGYDRIIKVNRVHLEEDAGKLVHSVDKEGKDISLVNFNRGGLPLVEMVSEPDIHSAEEAVAYAKELQLILRYLGASTADLENGQMRADVNISISDNDNLGTKVEIKNLNSFNSIGNSINYEIKRQAEILSNDKNTKIIHETRGWDDIKQKTFSQRSKEEAQDYRYFPEPDLPPLTKDGFDIEGLSKSIPELPIEKRARFNKQYDLSPDQISILIEDKKMSDYFEQSLSELEADNQKKANLEKIKLIFNYLSSDLRGLLIIKGVGFDECKITPENFADLIDMIIKKEITSRVAKDLLVKILETGSDPRDIVSQEGLGQISDEAGLKDLVIKIIEENPKAVDDYRKGKIQVVMFLIGKTMAILKGRGNPDILKKLFKENI
ncbi:Asp-tRNA(Asn)/Glu-tRNA(Gln) amidotransferase subunit GatB [Patescibacteria group bacterium]|nr:Asp-tRNA(Asn)/Glu-tRNA(Gln) amidotransferase subunit GatB [Patescibacteria group bacterium]